MGLGDFLKGAGKTVGGGMLDVLPGARPIKELGEAGVDIARGRSVGASLKEGVTQGVQGVIPGSHQGRALIDKALGSGVVEKGVPKAMELGFSSPVTSAVSKQIFGRDVVAGAGRELGASAVNLAKTASYLNNPEHMDEIAQGAVSAGKAIKKRPGVVKDVAKEIVKSETTPEAIIGNVALFAATAGIGTAAAASAKGARAGMVGAEAAEAVTAGTAGAEAISAASKTSKVAKILGTNETTLSKITSPISTATQGLRTKAAEKVLAGGTAETPSLMRQAVAAQIQQGGKSTLQPALEGIGPEVRRGQELTAQARAASKRVNQAKAAPEALHAAADPVGYAEQKATEAVFGKGGGGGGGPTYRTKPGGAAEIPGEGSTTPGVSANGVVQPDTWPTVGRQSTFQKLIQPKGIKGKSGGAASRMHAWEGPNREALGGIDVDYDWRRFQKRPMQPWGPLGQSKKKPTEKSAMYGGKPEGESQDGGGNGQPPLQTAGVPAKPTGPQPTLQAQAEMPKSAMYSGVSMPETTPGPRIMQPAGAGQRGLQTGRSETFTSGITYGEMGGQTIGGTKGWNADITGSMTFPDLMQPASDSKKATEVGNVKPIEPMNPSKPVEGFKPLQPLRPLGQPLKNRNQPQRQVLGV